MQNHLRIYLSLIHRHESHWEPQSELHQFLPRSANHGSVWYIPPGSIYFPPASSVEERVLPGNLEPRKKPPNFLAQTANPLLERLTFSTSNLSWMISFYNFESLDLIYREDIQALNYSGHGCAHVGQQEVQDLL